MYHWACELRNGDGQGNVVTDATRYTFDTYEQARRHADNEVARTREHIAAVVFSLRRRAPNASEFVPGQVRES